MIDIEPYAGLVLPHAVLTSILSNYKAPNFKIHSLLKENRLISLKKGLYAVAPKASDQLISQPLVANHLYGPSYVSLEFALSYYGVIPEQVADTTSVCIKRSKHFDTALGRFSYQQLPTPYYSLGIRHIKADHRVAFMMASPEKALCDWLTLTPNLRIYSSKGLKNLLLDDMRMDEEALSGFNLDLITHIAAAGFKEPRLKYLPSFLEGLSHARTNA